jgi:hypothetical protein
MFVVAIHDNFKVLSKIWSAILFFEQNIVVHFVYFRKEVPDRHKIWKICSWYMRVVVKIWSKIWSAIWFISAKHWVFKKKSQFIVQATNSCITRSSFNAVFTERFPSYDNLTFQFINFLIF